MPKVYFRCCGHDLYTYPISNGNLPIESWIMNKALKGGYNSSVKSIENNELELDIPEEEQKIIDDLPVFLYSNFTDIVKVKYMESVVKDASPRTRTRKN